MIYCFLKSYFLKISSFIETQVKYEFQESKKDLQKSTFLKKLDKPYLRTKNPEFFFLLELVIILFLAFSVYKWFSFFNYIINYAPNTMDNKWNIADIPFDQVERIELVRESWIKWYTYYYRNGIQTAEEQAQYYMQLGNLTRPLIMDTIQYVIIPMSIGYVVWFCIKYYEYVIAASWGWFIMMYSFMTKKVECTLAKKWYIQFVTGWKKCSPSFSKYLKDWYNRFIQRPLRQEQLNYMKAYDEVKYFRKRKDVNIVIDGIKNAIENIIDFIKNLLKKIYDIIYKFFSSLGEIFLKIYNFILSLFGVKYSSETNTGDSCECTDNPTTSSKTNTTKTPTTTTPKTNTSTYADKTDSSTNNQSGEKDSSSSQCKDSLFIDLLILAILLYPFKKYIPWEKMYDFFMVPINKLLQMASQKSGFSFESLQIVFFSLLAIFLYTIDIFLYR